MTENAHKIDFAKTGLSKASKRTTDSNYNAEYSSPFLFHLWTGLSCPLDMDGI